MYLQGLFTTARDWEVPCITSKRDAAPGPSPPLDMTPPLLPALGGTFKPLFDPIPGASMPDLDPNSPALP